MADLLECVIRMTALGASIDSLARIAGTLSAAFHERHAASRAQLTDPKRMYATALLGLRQPGLRPGTTSAQVQGAEVSGEWVGLRRANDEALGACTATAPESAVGLPRARGDDILWALSRRYS